MLTVDTLNVTVGDLQRNYLFKVMVPVLPTALPTVLPDALTIANNMDVYVEKLPNPESSNKPIGFKWSGEQVWYSGPNDAPMTVVLSLRCDRTWAAHKFFKFWKDLGGSDATQAAFPKPMTLGQMDLLTVDVDKTTVLHATELHKVQIFKVGQQEYDKGGDAEVKFDVTIHFERKIERYDNLGTV